MRIKTLRLKNLGPFKEAQVAFDQPVALIFGDNATGKTTIATAIEVLLTGRAARFAGHKIGLAALIGRHGDTAKIEATLDLATTGREATLVRRIGPKGLTTEVGGHASTKESWDFYSPPAMRHPERVWMVVCHVGGILDREVADQKALLLDLIDPALPSGALEGLRWDLTGGGAPTTLDQLEGAYQEAYRARRAAKARLADIVVTEPERPRADLGAIQKRLADLDARRATLEGQLGEGRGQRVALERERTHLVEVLDRTMIELGELGPEEVARKAVEGAQQALDAAQEAREAHQKAEQQVANAQGRVKAIIALEAILGRQGAECETCGTPLTIDQRRKRGEALKAERGTLEAWLKRHAQASLGDGVARAQRKLADAKHLLARIGERQLQQAKDRQRLKEYDADLAGRPVDPALDAELADVKGRIAKGQQLHTEAVALTQRWDRFEDAKIQQKKLGDDIVALEHLCDVLGPKGVGEQVLRERFGGVFGKLNRVLARFGLTMEVQDTPAWALRFNGRPALLLSGSERWRAGFCFQVAVGAFTGARLAVVDGADILDAANRTVLLTVAEHAVAAGLVEQVIITATPSHPTMLQGWAPPFRAYALRGGVLEKLPPQ